MIDLEQSHYSFQDLLEIMARLRQKEGGCPWDLAQTHESIRRNFIEEAYEAAEAIDQRDDAHLCEELGDVLLQVVFHAQIAREAGAFDMDDVCTGICKKLILRHPHIFGTADRLTDAGQTLDLWEEVKRKEKHQQTYTDAMNDVARSLPALIYAEKVQSRAKRSGFDWPEVSGALDKLREETAELEQVMDRKDRAEEELGDLLFAAVNVARRLELDPEQALMRATQKFMKRFALVEQAAGDKLRTMSLPEMTALWEQAKQQTAGS